MSEIAPYLGIAVISGWLGWRVALAQTKTLIVDPMIETKSIMIKGVLYRLTPEGKSDV